MSQKVHITEVGTRDGFQFLSEWIPTKIKHRVIQAVLKSGVPEVQVSSFVRSDLVPQMRDAEDLFKMLFDDGVEPLKINALVLNMRGFENALKTGVKSIEISISVNSEHGRRNAGMSAEESLFELTNIVKICKDESIRVRTGLQCVFGYKIAGDTDQETLVEFVRELNNCGPDVISLADTTGMANPSSIKKLVEPCIDLVPNIPMALHLHDTRGLGLANVTAALDLGVRMFDSSFGGLGGCPFVDGAAGNVASEDLVYLVHSLGYKTGIDLKALADIGVELSKELSIDLPSKIHQLSRLGEMSHVG